MPRCKGIVMAGLAQWLHAGSDDLRAGLAPRLECYLREPIIASAWYPEEDFVALLQVAGRVVAQGGLAADPFGYLGRTAARRDLLGDQLAVPFAARLPNAGQYAHLFVAGRPRHLMRCAAVLWSLYHDDVQVEVSPLAKGCNRLRVMGAIVGSMEVAQTYTAYIEEATRAAAGKIGVELLRSPGQGDGYYLWEIYRAGAARAYAPEEENTGSFALESMRRAVSTLLPRSEGARSAESPSGDTPAAGWGKPQTRK